MRKILSITATALLFGSCGEFLTPQSQNEYVPKSVEALSEVLVGEVYLSSTSNNSLFSLSEILSDNISTLNYSFAKIGDAYKNPMEQDKKIFCMNPEMFNPNVDDVGAYEPQTWQEYYKRIRSCNAILDYIESVRADNPDEKSRILAETYLFRAFFYFNLVNLFGEPYNVAPNALGVPIKLSSSYTPERMKRNSVKEVYEQIIKDLDLSESYYAKLNGGDYFTDIKLPSSLLLYAFRSRVALYMENWTDAKSYAEKVMHSQVGLKLYDLNQFSATNAAPYPSYTAANSETFFVYGNVGATTKFAFGQCEVPKKTGVNTTNSVLNLGYFVAAPELMASFDDDDLRKTLYVATEYRKSSPQGEIAGFYKIYGKININNKHEAQNGQGYFGYSFRLSEVYLNYAEACVKLNAEADARTKMKELLVKRYRTGSANAVVPAVSGDELLQFIRDERRKELCFEGHRWFDQRRYGMKAFNRTWYEGGVLITQIKVTEQDPAFTFKLTPTVLNNNDQLLQNRDWAIKY